MFFLDLEALNCKKASWIYLNSFCCKRNFKTLFEQSLLKVHKEPLVFSTHFFWIQRVHTNTVWFHLFQKRFHSGGINLFYTIKIFFLKNIYQLGETLVKWSDFWRYWDIPPPIKWMHFQETNDLLHVKTFLLVFSVFII